MFGWFQDPREADSMAAALAALAHTCSHEMETTGLSGLEEGLRKLGRLQHEEQDAAGRSLGVEVSIFGHLFDVIMTSGSSNCLLSFRGYEKYAGFHARALLPMKTMDLDLRADPVHGISRGARLLVEAMCKQAKSILP